MFDTKWIILIILGSLCLTPVMADEKADAARKQELKRLEGVWTVTEARHGGEVVEQSEKEEFEFKGGKLLVRKGERAPITLILRFDLSTDPKCIDWTTDPKGKFEDDKFAEGIYKLDGDKLTVCYNVNDNRFAKGNRPTKLESTEKSDAMLIIFKRAKR